MLQFDANAHADANVDARVNGPLVLRLIMSNMATSNITHLDLDEQDFPQHKVEKYHW